MINIITNKISPYQLFLLDGIGAMLTTCLLGFVLPLFNESIGLSIDVLHTLALLAFMITIYSLWNAFMMNNKWRILMKILALTNITYCFITAFVVSHFWEKITSLGILYFSIEVLIILCLVAIEFRKSNFNNNQ